MRSRHLDYPPDTPVDELGAAALDDLLERGDLEAWAPLARAVRADPEGELAATVLRLCSAHQMFGTSILWLEWISRLRSSRGTDDPVALAEIRRRRGLSQQAVGERLGISQSDVSKLERRADLRISTLRAYVEAVGGQLALVVSDSSGETTIAAARARRPPRIG